MSKKRGAASEKMLPKLQNNMLIKKIKSKKEALSQTAVDSTAYDDQMLMPSPSNKVFRFAIGFSIVLHLALLAVKFSDPVTINNFLRTTSLEVILINAASEDKPSEAVLVAQNDFAGGGESVEVGVYSSSPDEFSLQAQQGNDFEDTIRQMNEARQQTARELTSIKELYSMLPPIDPNLGESDPRRIAEEEYRRALSDKISAIEQRIEEENSRPRRMYIGPSTRSHVQAVYYDSIRKKIEIKGTESFPQHNGKPMYGSLLMEVSVNPVGVLTKTVIVESSGNPILDRQAQAIAASAGPFPAAPTELLKLERNIEFVFVMRFHFKSDGHVETELHERNASAR